MTEKKVKVFIPRNEAGDAAAVIGVNGVMHMVPRGEYVEVSEPVAEVIRLSQIGEQTAMMRERDIRGKSRIVE